MGAVRIRSDVERKRMFAKDEESGTDSAPVGGLYTDSATEQTYAHLAVLADRILQAGYPVLVDATFLDGRKRRDLYDVARRHDAPFHILSFRASEDALRRRVAERSETGADASDATLNVLQDQLNRREPLDDQERRFALDVNSEDPEAAEGEGDTDPPCYTHEGEECDRDDASCADGHVCRLHTEPDRANNLARSWVDPQERVIVAIADPDRPFPDCGSRRPVSDGDLAYNRVRLGVDDSDGVAREQERLARATRRVARGRH